MTRVGAAVTVIRGDDLRERGVPTVADALRSVPGVTIAQSGGRGTLTTVMIRGSDPRHVMVIIDGIEVNQLGFPGFDFADLPTDDIERIEVVRGPQSGIYGANAQSGVISIITRAGKGLSNSGRRVQDRRRKPQYACRQRQHSWFRRAVLWFDDDHGLHHERL